VDDFLKRRNAALATLDMEYAREALPDATSDEVRLVAMHKARYECVAIMAALRHESEDWLRQRGYSRIDGTPLLPFLELPAGPPH
jgi:hypothetical protein